MKFEKGHVYFYNRTFKSGWGKCPIWDYPTWGRIKQYLGQLDYHEMFMIVEQKDIGWLHILGCTREFMGWVREVGEDQFMEVKE